MAVPSAAIIDGTPYANAPSSTPSTLEARNRNSHGNPAAGCSYAAAAAPSPVTPANSGSGSGAVFSDSARISASVRSAPTIGHPYAEQPRFSSQQPAWNVSPHDGHVVIASEAPISE